MIPTCPNFVLQRIGVWPKELSTQTAISAAAHRRDPPKADALQPAAAA